MSDLDELLDRARRASQRLHGITIRGEGWSGDPRVGFIFNPTPGEAEEGGGTPIVNVGACCIGEDCSILSAADCASAGGVYQGDFTACFPNPCAPILPPCNGCGFDAFDGSGRKFLTRTWYGNYTINNSGDGCTSSLTSVRVDTVDTDTCEVTCDCSGTQSSALPPLFDCTAPTTQCDNELNPHDPNFGVAYAYANGCRDPSSCPGGVGSCCGYTISLDVDTATSRTFGFHCNPDLGCDECTGSVMVVLSDECQP